MRIRRVPLPKFSSVFHTHTHSSKSKQTRHRCVFNALLYKRWKWKNTWSVTSAFVFFSLATSKENHCKKKKKERKGGKKTLGPIASADQPRTLSLSRLTTFFFFCSCWSKRVDTSVTYVSHSCRQEKSVLLNEARQQHLSKGPNTTTAPSTTATTAKKSWA